MTSMSGQPSEMCISCNLRCPYQANVIQTFDPISKSIVQSHCISIQFINEPFTDIRKKPPNLAIFDG